MMKTLLLFGTFLLFSTLTMSTTVTITNSGFSFTPDNITINLGDIVDFQLGSSHNAVEVSESTWLANGNTPLPGFSLPFGGGQLPDLSPGVHYYVCTPHASLGMKGKITVTAPSGVADHAADNGKFKIFPNPTKGKFTLQIEASNLQSGNLPGTDQKMSLEVYDILGKRVFMLNDFILQTTNEMDLSFVPDGIYFVRINDKKRAYSIKLEKE